MPVLHVQTSSRSGLDGATAIAPSRRVQLEQKVPLRRASASAEEGWYPRRRSRLAG